MNLVSMVEQSFVAERVWMVLHTDIGPILVGNWYRPPDAPISHVDSLRDELARLSDGYIGVVLMGDMNIHHRKWLRYSNGNTGVGESLWHLCQEYGLLQRVSQPTRKEYLLDLVLSDLDVKVSVVPGITDHDIVQTVIPLSQSTQITAERKVWLFNVNF